MSNAERPTTHGEGGAPLPQPAADDLIELEPPFVFASQHAMRFGERTYTKRQAKTISPAVRRRSPLRVAPLPLDNYSAAIRLQVRESYY